MIEVELSFTISSAQEEILLKDAILVQEEILHDVYYDTQSKNLTSKDMRLRTRNGVFMLKAALRNLETNGTKVPKREIEDETVIRELLNLSSPEPLNKALEHAGYLPTLTLLQERRTYEKNGVTITISKVTHDEEVFQNGELEIVVDSEEHIEAARAKLLAFAVEQSIEIDTKAEEKFNTAYAKK